METKKVRFIGLADEWEDLIPGKIYERWLYAEDDYMWRIVDESGEDYMYPKEDFEIVDDCAPDRQQKP